ncbi:hypothetical protein CONPUDRAFT_165841 [Coniophora puteana RWD-64-598 SS2]|uniref:Uncharacterized protein n=1 Tax=Coniophora puteana (strain RWD-64-598) TaxID=741705 RepID=A0A5M3MML5_CONPW|nr:uncharacterized protein CONPUDRAFT_165841 [Coniophora puteana RWD-64-598 SS2]EIW80267.1 hypothetical protein CONPUDRAFT_165841 [Coniophora puteana RWD-64-598 SS2]
MIIEPAKADEIQRERQQNRPGDEALPPPAYNLEPSPSASSSSQTTPPNSYRFTNASSSLDRSIHSSQAFAQPRSTGSGTHAPPPQIVLAPPDEEPSSFPYQTRNDVSYAPPGLRQGSADVYDIQDRGAGPSRPHRQTSAPWLSPSMGLKDLPMNPGQRQSVDKNHFPRPPSPYDAWEPHSQPSGSSRSSIASSSQGPPQAWNRLPPSRDASTTYAPFEPPLVLHSHSGHLSKGFPKLPPPCAFAPHPFATHDIRGEDWQKFLADIKKTASVMGDMVVKGVAPAIREHTPLGGLIGLVFDGAKNAIKAMSGGPKPGTVVDDWNTFFFNPRRLNVTLLQGQRRLSGFSAEQHNASYARSSSTSKPSIPSRPSPRAWDPAYISHVSASASQPIPPLSPLSTSSSYPSPPPSAGLLTPSPYAPHGSHKRSSSAASLRSSMSFDRHSREFDEGRYDESVDYKGKQPQSRTLRAREKADTQFTLVVEPF